MPVINLRLFVLEKSLPLAAVQDLGLGHTGSLLSLFQLDDGRDATDVPIDAGDVLRCAPFLLLAHVEEHGLGLVGAVECFAHRRLDVNAVRTPHLAIHD
ncbi:hypothetical protein KCU61_g547, partial [Aureobasidium melanogenum]